MEDVKHVSQERLTEITELQQKILELTKKLETARTQVCECEESMFEIHLGNVASLIACRPLGRSYQGVDRISDTLWSLQLLASR